MSALNRYAPPLRSAATLNHPRFELNRSSEKISALRFSKPDFLFVPAALVEHLAFREFTRAEIHELLGFPG
jgi:hypothetical protein